MLRHTILIVMIILVSVSVLLAEVSAEPQRKSKTTAAYSLPEDE
jgi:hypothetical protein